MKNAEKILFYIFIIICIILFIFAIVKYRGNKKEIADITEQLRSAENRIVNIKKELTGAGKIISDLRNTAEQERISHKELEKYSNELEDTIRKQREIYNRLTESNKLDSAGIGRLEGINQSNDNIVRELLAELSLIPIGRN